MESESPCLLIDAPAQLSILCQIYMCESVLGTTALPPLVWLSAAILRNFSKLKGPIEEPKPSSTLEIGLDNRGVALMDEENKILIAHNRALTVADRATGEARTFDAPKTNSGRGIRVLQDGKTIALTGGSTSNVALYHIPDDPTASELNLATSITGLRCPVGLDMDPRTGDLITASFSHHAVFVFPANTLASLSDEDGRQVSYKDLPHRKITNTASGQNDFQQCFGVGLMDDGETLLVAQYGNSKLLIVDYDTGAVRRAVAHDSFENYACAVVPRGDQTTAFLIFEGGSVFLVDFRRLEVDDQMKKISEGSSMCCRSQSQLLHVSPTMTAVQFFE